MANTSASIITIGDELLIGQTIDTNSAWIAQQLNALGIAVLRRVAVGDERGAIVDALDEEIDNADIVLVTGGLGPTADDITKPLLCEYFGGKLVVDEKVLAHVKDIFTRRHRPFLDRNMKQAEVPDVCTVMFNRVGTAPGMMFRSGEKVIIAMPGVPFEMMAIMEDEVIPYLKANTTSDVFLHRSVITAGEGESFIAERIIDLETALPSHIKLAYLPAFGIVKLRLTGSGANEAELVKELEYHQQAIAARLDNIVIALDDVPLEVLVGNVLLEKNVTLSLAESCTGGNIGHLITQVEGSSRYFIGSIVCYQNEVKENILGVPAQTIAEYGVYSEPVAIAMAEGARNVLKSDYSLSVTGLLSADENEQKVPVGTVWMAVSDSNRTVTKEFRYHYDRKRNKEMAVQAGLLLIWRFLQNKI
jgi:nicotinamide-nucleotide amidase